MTSALDMFTDAASGMADCADDELLPWIRWTPPQDAWLRLNPPSGAKLFRAGNQAIGKAQPLDARVMTPSGWRAIGALAVGDEVYAGDGIVTRVTSVHPQGVRPIFRVTFDDGASTRCCAEHLWRCRTRAERFRPRPPNAGGWRVLSLQSIIDQWGMAPKPVQRIAIPTPPPVDRPPVDLPLAPYLIGALLGDGGLTGGSVRFTSADVEVVDQLQPLLPPPVRITKVQEPYYYALSTPRGAKNPLIAALKAIGMWGVIGHEKRVPTAYLHGSAEQRTDLLRGLMDTDGACTERGHVFFASSSRGLADDVVEIVRSLGGKAHWRRQASYLTREGATKRVRDMYIVIVRLPTANPFRLPRKAERWFRPTSRRDERVMYKIEPDGVADAVCIEVDHPESTYITDDYIVTHNTFAQMAEVIWRCLGTHPHYPTKAPPVEVWVVCTSWAQSVAIQQKFWTLAPHRQLTARTRDRYRIDDGWGRVNPLAIFNNGSIVRFRTTNQGPEAQAGATVDYVAMDEPPDEEVFRELRKRVMRSGGQIGLTLTPINRPCGWIREEVRAGRINEVHARLVPENLIPIGSDQPLTVVDPYTRLEVPMDAAWIEHQRAITPAAWAPVVLDGEWEIRPQGVFFKCFDAAKHVNSRASFNPRRGPIRHVLGLDYAAADRPYGHCAALTQVQEQPHEGATRYAVIALDEVVLPGTATNPQFAREILSMLERNGLRWSDLFAVHGDNPVTSNFVERSNAHTMRAIATELQIPNDAVMPRIRSAKEGHRSDAGYDMGNQWVYEHIASGLFIVHPRCEATIKGYETWDYSKLHQSKDILDSRRYSLMPFIFATSSSSGVVVRLY